MSDVADLASPAALLQDLAGTLAPERIDELWIFPPRAIGPGQSTIIVASVFDLEEEPDRRAIFTARFTLGKDARGRPELRRELTEDGAAPADRVGRVVDGVVRRLDEDAAPPRHARLEGSPERWLELLQLLSGEG